MLSYANFHDRLRKLISWNSDATSGAFQLSNLAARVLQPPPLGVSSSVLLPPSFPPPIWLRNLAVGFSMSREGRGEEDSAFSGQNGLCNPTISVLDRGRTVLFL